MEDVLQAASIDELRSALGRLDIDVPERSSGRRSHHAERYCIAHLLATLAPSRLSFPLTLVHDDRPDFVLSMPGISIGIEHTEAVPENVARAQFLREKGAGPDVYFTPHATPGEPRKTSTALLQEIEADEDGDGWVGDGPDREWADAVVHFVKEKLAKATATGFKRFPQNWLLVYDNWPLPHVNWSLAAPRALSLLQALDAFTVFDAIFVMDGSQLCEFRDPPLISTLGDPRSGS